jgi:hypothetical protein
LLAGEFPLTQRDTGPLQVFYCDNFALCRASTAERTIIMSELLHTGPVEQFLEIAQREIAFCEHCQPNGVRVPLQKFLTHLGVPANEQEYLAESLECNHCGAVLELVSEVGIRPANKKNLDDLRRRPSLKIASSSSTSFWKNIPLWERITHWAGSLCRF